MDANKCNVRLPGAVVLGGGANAVSVVRCLGRRGIRVYAVNAPNTYLRYSRYCHFICPSKDGDFAEAWERYLLGDESEHLRGSVLLACNDTALEILIKNRENLSKRFVLDIMNKEAQLCMLNKLGTYEAARSAGIPAPRFWKIGNGERVGDIIREASFPLMIKPVYSHRFEKRYGRKYLLAKNRSELQGILDSMDLQEDKVILMEVIPGPDDQLCSYYTYIDENGESLFDFTKRIIRRCPPNEGNGCYHVTDRVDEVKELALKLFRSIGLKGVANVEFKRDYRDGKLKLIECNARFTAANCLLAKSGIDLASFVYYRLLGTQLKLPSSFKVGKRLWYPWQDFSSFYAIRRRGEITLAMWVKSLMHPQSFPYFAWDDPRPSLLTGFQACATMVKNRVSRLVRGVGISRVG
jgi:predicted ATP-grasp superfamily ATP-dependent carboligase